MFDESESVTYLFDEYNEQHFVKTHEKTFSSGESARLWFLSQDGHPFLSYSNYRVKPVQ